MLPVHFRDDWTSVDRTALGQGGLWGARGLCPVGDGREDGWLRMVGGGTEGLPGQVRGAVL